MRRRARGAADLAAIVGMMFTATAHAQQFDPQALQRLGISPEAAAYFSKAARFLPGVNRVRLKINGVDLGTTDVRFNEEGVLCFTPELLRRAGLKVPDGTSEEACPDYRKAYPETDITQLPNLAQVDIVTPLSARAPVEEALEGQYASGGNAAVVNYTISGSRSSGGGGSGYQYLRAYTETGVNIADWIVRSRQDYYSQRGSTVFTQGDTYAQRAVPGMSATFQAGQISPIGSLFAVGTLRGAQLFPEYALRQMQASGVGFNGIAATQSRIEVRQLGTLILMTQVPAGAYTISDVPIVSSNADLDVQVISANGERQQFTVPAASFGEVRNTAAPGLSIALGRYQAYRGGNNETPLVATVSNGWNLGPRTVLSAGALASSPYRAVAATITSTSKGLSGSIGVRVSSAKVGGETVQGQQIISTVSVSPLERLSASFSATWQTLGYRDMPQVVQRSDNPNASASASQAYTASASWYQPVLGSLSASFSTSRVSTLSVTRRRAMLSWSRSFGRASVTLSASKDLSSDPRARADNQYFLTVSVPLGSASVSTYVSKTGNSNTVGATYSDTVGPQFSYNVSSSVANPGKAVNSSVSIDALPRYTRVNASVSRDPLGSTSMYWGLQGAVVAAGGAVALSPYNVGDTFGIAKVGELSGVEIQTPVGPAWTDSWGHAVIPGMPAYTESVVTITPQSLPRNANLPNGIQTVKPARGSVQVLDFNLRQVQRYLLSAVLEADRQPLEERLVVMDGRGNLVTLVGRQGQIFLDDTYPAPLQVTLQDGSKCFLEFEPVGKPDPDLPYQDASAVCRKQPRAAKAP